MRDGIAHQVQKGIGNHIGERFLDAHVSAPNLKFYLLSQMMNCDSAGTRGGALENFAGRYEPQLNQPLFKSDESHAQVSGGRLGRLRLRRAANSGEGIGSLAGKFTGG